MFRSHRELVVILRDSKHRRLIVRVRHLHGNQASLLGPVAPIFRILSVPYRGGTSQREKYPRANGGNDRAGDFGGGDVFDNVLHHRDLIDSG